MFYVAHVADVMN